MAHRTDRLTARRKVDLLIGLIYGDANLVAAVRYKGLASELGGPHGAVDLQDSAFSGAPQPQVETNRPPVLFDSKPDRG